MTWALAGFLFLAPLWAWHIGAGWPATLRDNAFKTLGAVSVVILATICWPLALLWGLALYHWKDPNDVPKADMQPPIAGVLSIGSIAAVFFLVAQVPQTDLSWLRWSILAAGLLQCGVLVWQAVAVSKLPTRTWAPGEKLNFWRDSLRGSMGNRVVTGGFLAFCFALSPAPLLPVFGLGVLATNSFTALGGALIALALRYPSLALYWGPVVLLGGYLCLRWRGHPRDSFAGRRTIWRLMVDAWLSDGWQGRLLGHGHWSFARQARWWHAQGLVRDIYSHAHSDPLQVVMEYGVLGVIGFGAWLWMLGHGMAIGDPWTAALIAGLAMSCNQFTLHVPHTGLPVVAAAGVLWAR